MEDIKEPYLTLPFSVHSPVTISEGWNNLGITFSLRTGTPIWASMTGRAFSFKTKKTQALVVFGHQNYVFTIYTGINVVQDVIPCRSSPWILQDDIGDNLGKLVQEIMKSPNEVLPLKDLLIGWSGPFLKWQICQYNPQGYLCYYDPFGIYGSSEDYTDNQGRFRLGEFPLLRQDKQGYPLFASY